MSMFLLEGSSHRSCNLASECTHVCWLVWVGVCAFLCVGWYVPPEVRVDCPLKRPCHGFAALETKSDPSTQGSKNARRYRQPPETSRLKDQK